jgi:IPT/TIG domain
VLKRPGSFRILFVGAVALAAVATAAALGFSGAASASTPSAPSTWVGNARGIALAHGAQPVAAAPAPAPLNLLSYHSGPVMRTNTVYAIYWSPSATSYPYGTGYQTTINTFFQNVAADNGKSSNVYSTDTQYSDNTGPIAYNSTFAGFFNDTDPYPSNGCTNSPYATKCLSDTQIQSELNSFTSAHGLPRTSTTTLYFVFTPKNVGSCYSTGVCSFSYYCAYHSNGNGQNAPTTLLYANMPYADISPGSSDAGQHPNGNDADATINVTSHEHNEAITDPYGSGWWDDSNGEENGDLCAWNFGTQLGNNGKGNYNQVINGGQYELQGEWSNADGGCMWNEVPAAPPSVTNISPTTVSDGTSVTIAGSGLSGVTSVTFNGQAAASFTINSDTQITATAPCGVTAGQVSVSGPNGSASSGGYSVVAPSQPAITSFTPTSGSAGTSVTITGTNLLCATSVGFGGGASAAPTSASTATQVTVKVPSGAQTGPLTVSTLDGGTSPASSGTFTISAAAAPVITSFSPSYGFHGAKVTIKGSHFTGATIVTLRGFNAAFTVNSDTQITATVPTIARGYGRWAVTTPGGTATSTGQFYVLG